LREAKSLSGEAWCVSRDAKRLTGEAYCSMREALSFSREEKSLSEDTGQPLRA
jgi:hypothetical protein